MAATILFVAATLLALAHGSVADLAPIDEAVLNFALNLEYLEANFYSCAAYGTPIDMNLWGSGGMPPMGCEKAKLSNKMAAVANEIAQDEIAHVKLLRAVLGDKAVPQPVVDIGMAFKNAANAAASLAFNATVTLEPDFSPYSGDVTFLHGAFIFEDVGATAYAGAAALIVDKAYLTAAAQILSVESYHAGAVRYALGVEMANDRAPFSKPMGDLRVRTVVQAISDLRDAVDGSSDIDQGVVVDAASKNSASNIVPADANGLIYTRNTDQILRIVYLGGYEKGGFFPQGLNGAIKVAAMPAKASH
ncbi:hypothetical protein HYH03_000335 [Edaphochlamys debaryana]|uniref:Desiccation-related protein PCC13-62 n=1 Tax=Edaphochlamys debaryana TaxID=47281 RepID=A0A836C7J3_9CHLO|nr:hypothetical protein HYH03_000335 [Edaphochlamys debaryana]|eukprot:KAG2501837.1 hypothetical protein HYH03_000335 [Edaphochlamys debaryana]